MRHRRSTTKLGRKTEHRDALISNQVCSLILHERIRTTLAKAKAVRPVAEKMVTLGKSGTLHDRRNAAAFLTQKEAVKKLFNDIAVRCASRSGGYTRIVKLGPRLSDSAPMAYLEWVDAPQDNNAVAERPGKGATAKGTKSRKKTSETASDVSSGKSPPESSRQNETTENSKAQVEN